MPWITATKLPYHVYPTFMVFKGSEAVAKVIGMQVKRVRKRRWTKHCKGDGRQAQKGCLAALKKSKIFFKKVVDIF